MTEASFAERYRLNSMIGAGSFGKVYIGTDTKSSQDVAVKIAVAAQSKCLAREFKAYQLLSKAQVTPEPRWFGTAGNSTVMVTELLGPSLEDLFNFCERRLSLKTVLELADQMLDCLDIVHGHGLVHRDIKPDNFMIGLGPKASTVFLGDFGLVGVWRDPQTQEHVPRRTGLGVTGTVRYMSLNAHWGIEQSRRDDLESLGYMLVFFLRGDLPWQDARGSTGKSLQNLVLDRKLNTSIEDLCRGLPDELADYLKYCRRLRFEESPDYGYLRELLSRLFRSRGHQYDNVYDWTLRMASVAMAQDKQEPKCPNDGDSTVTPSASTNEAGSLD